MKHLIFIAISFLSISSLDAMQGSPHERDKQTTQPHISYVSTFDIFESSPGPLPNFRELDENPAENIHNVNPSTRVLSSKPPEEFIKPATFFHAPELVHVDLERGLTSEALNDDKWKQELVESIHHTRSHQLRALLSEGLNTPQKRGFEFKPYTNALDQVQAHKAKEERILTNTAEPTAQCCKHCNFTYVWNRYCAPSIIVSAKIGQIVFAGWGIYRAASQVLQDEPTNYYLAAANAAPAIGSIISACGDLPFSLVNAWRRRILKSQQAKYEYYVLAEHNIQTHEELLTLVKEIHKNQLSTGAAPQRNSEPLVSTYNSNMSDDLENAFNNGIPLGDKE